MLNKILCWLGFHPYTRWEIRHEGNVKTDGKVHGYYIAQQRSCIVCNKIQLREVSYDSYHF